MLFNGNRFRHTASPSKLNGKTSGYTQSSNY